MYSTAAVFPKKQCLIRISWLAFTSFLSQISGEKEIPKCYFPLRKSWVITIISLLWKHHIIFIDFAFKVILKYFYKHRYESLPFCSTNKISLWAKLTKRRIDSECKWFIFSSEVKEACKMVEAPLLNRRKKFYILLSVKYLHDRNRLPWRVCLLLWGEIESPGVSKFKMN